MGASSDPTILVYLTEQFAHSRRTSSPIGASAQSASRLSLPNLSHLRTPKPGSIFPRFLENTLSPPICSDGPVQIVSNLQEEVANA